MSWPRTWVLMLAVGLVGTVDAGRIEGSEHGLTTVAGVKVGHHTLSERPTGCTVILTEAGAVAGVDVRGGGPAAAFPSGLFFVIPARAGMTGRWIPACAGIILISRAKNGYDSRVTLT